MDKRITDRRIKIITGSPRTGKTYFVNHLGLLTFTLDCYNDNSITGCKININDNVLGTMNVCVNQLTNGFINPHGDTYNTIVIDGFDIFYSKLFKEYNYIISRRYWEQSVIDDVYQAVELKVFEWFSTLLSFGYNIILIVGKTTGSQEIDDNYRSINKIIYCFNKMSNNVDTLCCFFDEKGTQMIDYNNKYRKFDEVLKELSFSFPK